MGEYDTVFYSGEMVAILVMAWVAGVPKYRGDCVSPILGIGVITTALSLLAGYYVGVHTQ